MIAIIKYYRLSFLLYAIMLISGICLVLLIPKLELHTIMNSSHTVFQDFLFKTLTLLGDGWVALIFCLIFLFFRFRYFFMLILSYCISGLLVQFLKRMIFPGAMRPAAFLEQMPGLPLVTGVNLHHAFSFPSGHTTTAFAVLLLAGFISRNRLLTFICMIIACSVALSRVYLSQHFLVDILGGSMIGVLSALFFYWYFQSMKREWLDHSIRFYK